LRLFDVVTLFCGLKFLRHEPALLHIEGSIECALIGVRLDVVVRKYNPHVTLAWVKELAKGKVGLVADHEELNLLAFNVDGFTLYYRQLGNSDVHHKMIRRWVVG
jgi:2'-5' RNA ligase